MVTIGSGGGKVVLPLMTSSLVLLRLSFIKFSSAQTLIFSTSSEALSLTLGPTGILHVMSSAYLVIKVFWEVGLISLTMMVESTGPRTVPWGTPRLTGKNGVMTLSTHTLCWRSFEKSITQLLTPVNKDNVRHFLKFISYYSMGNWVKDFREVKRQNSNKVRMAIKPSHPKVLII